MGILDRIKKVFAPVTKEDPVFGLLRKERGWWQADALFPPLGKKVFCSIDGGDQAPAEIQREFFGEIQKRWPDLLEKVCPLLQEETRRWLERELNKDIFDDFNPPAIDIPEIESSDFGTVEWQLAFEFDKPDERWFYVRILMSGWEPAQAATDT